MIENLMTDHGDLSLELIAEQPLELVREDELDEAMFACCCSSTCSCCEQIQ